MEQLDYNLLYHWVVGLGVCEPVRVATVLFSKNRDRLLEPEVARKFLVAPQGTRSCPDEHSSVDGTQIAAGRR